MALASPKDMYYNSHLGEFKEAYKQDRNLWVRNELERDPTFSTITGNPQPTLKSTQTHIRLTSMRLSWGK